MFSKKKCKKCGNKVSERYSFSPACGTKMDSDENWGMLGRNDFFEETDPLKLFGGGMLGKMLTSAMRMLEKEMQTEMKQQRETQSTGVKTNVELYINGKKINPVNVRVEKINKEKPQKKPHITFSAKRLANFAKLPKEEPETNVKRLSDSVIYEIFIPGVKSEEDVSITKLENSIEIKAVAKNKAYYKIIKVGLPVISYEISNGKLILELEAKN